MFTRAAEIGLQKIRNVKQVRENNDNQLRIQTILRYVRTEHSRFFTRICELRSNKPLCWWHAAFSPQGVNACLIGNYMLYLIPLITFMGPLRLNISRQDYSCSNYIFQSSLQLYFTSFSLTTEIQCLQILPHIFPA